MMGFDLRFQFIKDVVEQAKCFWLSYSPLSMKSENVSGKTKLFLLRALLPFLILHQQGRYRLCLLKF